jgi:SAM-dependent methyltransferase
LTQRRSAVLPLRWPLPALLVWAAAWALFMALRGSGFPAWAGALAATLLGVSACGVTALAATRWRRAFVAAGFPLSFALSLGSAWSSGGALAHGVAAMPAWAWLLPLALLLALYPLKAWGDAPLFPTPRGALRELARVAPLAPGAAIADAGCGLGAGLRELRAAYPGAQLVGIEWSRLLAWVCAGRCGLAKLRAQVRRADIWATDWSAFQMVYLFQRPESMARAAHKAEREMRPGAWLVSLEFEVPSCAPHAVLRCDDGRRVFIYRAPWPVPGQA